MACDCLLVACSVLLLVVRDDVCRRSVDRQLPSEEKADREQRGGRVNIIIIIIIIMMMMMMMMMMMRADIRNNKE
jgi:heme/copper-type cytochrome/quinol oxidase subunit 2